jgi:hypothetical protein
MQTNRRFRMIDLKWSKHQSRKCDDRLLKIFSG